MGIFLIIISIVLVLSSIVGLISNGKVAEISFEIYKYSVIALSAVCVCGIIKISTPQAMDVYQGKTILEISYRDSIPVDSTVVFKK